MAESYPNLKAVAAAHGVTAAAVSGWVKKSAWPIPKGEALDKAKIDAFVLGWVAPNRKGKRSAAAASSGASVQAGNGAGGPACGSGAAGSAGGGAADAVHAMAPGTVAATKLQPDPVSSVDVEALPTLEELENAIKRAKTPADAQVLGAQVLALSRLQTVKERDGVLIDAGRAKNEVRAVLHFFQVTVMNVPRAIAGSLEGLGPGDIEVVLEGRFTELLGELQRGLERAVGGVPGNIEQAVVGGDARDARRTEAAEAEPDGGAVPGAEPAAVEPAGAVG